MELAELFRRELSRAARRLLEADARLARGPGPSAVHDARVALTRARALLRTFRSLLEPAALRCARPELAWVDALLAPVRDLDVVAARLLEHAAPGPGGRPRPLDAALTAALAADRAAELSCLGSARSSGRYTLALSLVDAWGDDPPLRPRAAREARDLLPPLLTRAHQELATARRSARRRPDGPTLHALRVRARTLRYATELSVPAFGEPAARLAKSCERLQDHLGRREDVEAASRWLESRAARADALGAACARLADEERALAGRLSPGWRPAARGAERSFERLARSWTS